MSFVNAHFVTYVQDLGYQQMVAAGAFSLIGAAAIITSFSTASVVLWSGVALSIMGGIVGASRFARSQPSRAQASA